MTALAVAVLAALAAFGVLVTVSAWTTPPSLRTSDRAPLLTAELLARAGGAVVAGAVGLVATGWVVAGVAAGAGGWAAVAMWQRRGSGGAEREQARIEALASWCEQLRDLLSADNGIHGTIEATAATCPAALRPEVSRLAARLTRQAPEVAVRQFAAEVDDPSGDLVASVILLAMSRSGRTADLLSELATTIRERATMRLRVEADRAGQRSEAKFVLVFGVVVLVGVVIFGRGSSFLAAYDTATGQLVLGLVVAMYGFGMWWLSRLIRFERPARFLSAGIDVEGGTAMMLLALAASLCFAGGVWLIVSAVWPARPSLAAALARLHTPGEPRSIIPTTASDRAVVVRAGRWLLRRIRAGVLADDRTLSDLAVVTRPLEVYAGACALCAVGGLALGPLLWMGAAIGGSQLPILVPIWFSLLGAVGGFLAPRAVLRAEASTARANFRHALSAYLDVLVLLLAAGEGPEGAMETAARAGNGMAFIELRRATNQARLSGEPVWDTLDDLGRRLDVVELREIAAAGNLAGEQGAAVRRSLMAKARSLRTTSLSAAESQARRRSQSMFLPVVLMGVGFILFLLYPLITNIQIG